MHKIHENMNNNDIYTNKPETTSDGSLVNQWFFKNCQKLDSKIILKKALEILKNKELHKNA